ncbi:uncharacterized protein SPPG_02802 [Spizellomyces punctatus DAOM BR117]|uniref:Uncharacterized protein n=1 Tax=Spizellomyces punctatus (strain DAOM BR117) TaxID=645134 RepID=A0A0L0HND2_SPIPD|nr:uncharacterized protein SPPG_02802 [Spizellomyces punctatus DAOM BR117]KND02329.1 hypothetical protein SPPG_02802 [Spizellomyces punctatus DAOM BR117]|eukprot:XP_016610368.1 hypothetical protein SPPG_02802 [Spizellomyces punctatus DAOM BR117]
MHAFTTLLVALAAIALLISGSNAVKAGGKCTPSKDTYACKGKDFLQCNAATGNWTVQNTCQEPCANVPQYAAFCNVTKSLKPTATRSRKPTHKATHKPTHKATHKPTHKATHKPTRTRKASKPTN